MGGVGVSIVSTMWERREALHHTQLSEQINPYSSLTVQTVHEMTNRGLSEQQVASFVKDEYDFAQMNQIREGYMSNLSEDKMEILMNPKFNNQQMYQIFDGFKKRLSVENVKRYAKPEFNFEQMREIKLSLIKRHSKEIIEIMSNDRDRKSVV